MKKKFVIPSLLLACSLTACDDGLVKSGVAYKDGMTASVDASLKKQKEGSYKLLTIDSTVDTKFSVETNGKKQTNTGKANGTIKIDVDQQSVEIEMDTNSKSTGVTQELKGSVKAKKTNGKFKVVNSEGTIGELYSLLDFDAYYTNTIYTTYSWNYSFSDSDIRDALASVSGSLNSSMGQALTDIKNNMLIDGNPEKGTFDVGISKAISFNVENVTLEYTKMKYTYKNCLLQGYTMGISASTEGVKFEIEGTYNYSYK